MPVHAVLFHGDMEHLRSRLAVDVTTRSEQIHAPGFSRIPGDDPRLDGGEVCHIKAAAGFRHKRSADKFGQYQRHGVIEHFHGVRIAAAHQGSCGIQIRQMVLGEILHLYESTGVAAGAVGTVKLDQSSGPVI